MLVYTVFINDKFIHDGEKLSANKTLLLCKKKMCVLL